MTRKRFGQHFLHEQGVIQRIRTTLNPQRNDRLVEIGPGQGALTMPLLERVERLSVIEIDRELVAALRAHAKHDTRLEVVEGDALKIDYAQLAAQRGGALRLVGNLPYNISSPLLFALLSSPAPISDMHFMLQKEVVDRMTAPPGGRDYGRLSVTLAARAHAEHLFDVAPGAFKPPPRVTSAVVRITPRPPAFAIDDPVLFYRMVTAAFGQRRKTLRNSLGAFVGPEIFQSCDIDPSLRAERLAPADFARLANAVKSAAQDDARAAGQMSAGDTDPAADRKTT